MVGLLLLKVFMVLGCGTSQRTRAEIAQPIAAQLGSPTAGLHREINVIATDADAMVLVDRRLVGLAPQRIKVPVTAQGFMAAPTTVTVRFIAHDATEAATTTRVTLETTDRPPQRLEFDREAARRIFGELN